MVHLGQQWLQAIEIPEHYLQAMCKSNSMELMAPKSFQKRSHIVLSGPMNLYNSTIIVSILSLLLPIFQIKHIIEMLLILGYIATTKVIGILTVPL